jgi:hypothetical protein
MRTKPNATTTMLKLSERLAPLNGWLEGYVSLSGHTGSTKQATIFLKGKYFAAPSRSWVIR